MEDIGLAGHLPARAFTLHPAGLQNIIPQPSSWARRVARFFGEHHASLGASVLERWLIVKPGAAEPCQACYAWPPPCCS